MNHQSHFVFILHFKDRIELLNGYKTTLGVSICIIEQSHALESAHILNLLRMYAFNIRQQSTAIVQRA